MTSSDTPDIPREFPKLDYIERCYIANLVNKVGGIDSSGMSEVEFHTDGRIAPPIE